MAINLSRILSFFGLANRDVPPVTDRPVPFGYKTTWLAVRSDSTEAVCEALAVTQTNKATWVGGVSKSAGKTWVFLTPPIEGWVLVLTGRTLSSDSEANVEHLHSLLNRLSLAFGEAQYFGSYRGVGYVAWFKSVAGQCVRAFSYADGTVFANEGETTVAETELGYPDAAADMDEETPMRMAGKWSIDPLLLGAIDANGPGVVGVMEPSTNGHTT